MIKYLMLCSIYFVWRQFQTGVVYVKKKMFFLENTFPHFSMTLNMNLLTSYSNLCARSSRI